MASGKQRPAGRSQEPRIPRGFDSSDPERQREVAPASSPAPGTGPARAGEGIAPRGAPDGQEEGGTRGR